MDQEIDGTYVREEEREWETEIDFEVKLYVTHV